MICSACNQNIIYERDILKCTSCATNYHYACLNITSAYYLDNMFELKKSWKCPPCSNVSRRNRNDDTPVRQQYPSPSMNDTSMMFDESTTEDTLNNAQVSTNNQNYIYKTPTNNTPTTNLENRDILQQISKLLEVKLEENRRSMLSDLTKKMDEKIEYMTNKLYTEMTKKTDDIQKDQTTMKIDIEHTNKKIESLYLENKKLQEEIQQLKDIVQASNQHQNTDNSKKIVLFGLNEPDYETEQKLYYQITSIFQNLMNVDLTGYIETLSRIGRKNQPRRPIIIELLSKQMTKYILHNSQLLRNSGLSISEYLDRNTLQHRKTLQAQVKAARNDGHQATIRNNKLQIDGHIVDSYLPRQPAPQTRSSQRGSYAASLTSHSRTVSSTLPNNTHRDSTITNTQTFRQ